MYLILFSDTEIQYIPRNMHTVFALLCFVVVIHWLIFPYPSGLLHWHCGNLTIAPVPAKQPWWIWINTSCEFIMNDCITTTKQSTTKPCAYFLGYTVKEHDVLHVPNYHRFLSEECPHLDAFGKDMLSFQYHNVIFLFSCSTKSSRSVWLNGILLLCPGALPGSSFARFSSYIDGFYASHKTLISHKKTTLYMHACIHVYPFQLGI